MPAATIRFGDETHHALTVALAINGDTLQGLMDRAVAEYLDQQEKPTPERERFIQTAKLFWKVARPDVREWLLVTMQGTIDKSERK